MKAIINKPDVVKSMREIRDQLCLDIMNMSFEEQKTYVKKTLKNQKENRIKDNNIDQLNYPQPEKKID